MSLLTQAPTIAAGAAWTNPNNVLADDASHATISLANTTASGALVVTAFGFDIPPGAIVVGVTATVIGKRSIGDNVQISTVQLVGGGAGIGDDLGPSANITTSDVSYVFGSGINRWGAILTGGVVNAAAFGVQVKVKKPAHTVATTALLDHILLSLVYSEPGRAVRSTTVRSGRVGRLDTL